MKIEEIFSLWEVDCVIDRTELGTAALDISKLHKKYYQIFVNERMVLLKYEGELKILKLEKYEFYTQGPTKEQIDLGWRLPPIGKIIRSDVDTYIEADKDIIKATLRVAVQKEKISLLESIIRSLMNRNFNIKSAIDWERFKNGG